MKAALTGAAFLFFLSGCATPPPFNNPERLHAFASAHNFAPVNLKHGPIRLAAFSKRHPFPTDELVIYIEGDGAPWPSPYHPPVDPTPREPTSWNMAMKDPAPAVVYLGRPCQYLDAAGLRQCYSRYWTERIFSHEVITAYADALDQLKLLYRSNHIRLFGYSGGGVISALLTAQRQDVALLVTIAAPLSLSDWIAAHGASPLAGSLDPAEPDTNSHLPQGIHLAGGKDKVVPVHVVEKYIERKGGRLEVVPDFDHDCCWVRDWTIMLQRISAVESTK